MASYGCLYGRAMISWNSSWHPKQSAGPAFLTGPGSFLSFDLWQMLQSPATKGAIALSAFTPSGSGLLFTRRCVGYLYGPGAGAVVAGPAAAAGPCSAASAAAMRIPFAVDMRSAPERRGRRPA